MLTFTNEDYIYAACTTMHGYYFDKYKRIVVARRNNYNFMPLLVSSLQVEQLKNGHFVKLEVFSFLPDRYFYCVPRGLIQIQNMKKNSRNFLQTICPMGHIAHMRIKTLVIPY